MPRKRERQPEYQDLLIEDQGIVDEDESVAVDEQQLLSSLFWSVVADNGSPTNEDGADKFLDLSEPTDLEDDDIPNLDAEDFSVLDAHISADDPVAIYFKEMGRTPLLTADEEIELAKRIEAGGKDGQEAKEHLARANTRLVISIAKRYIGRGLPFPDLIQEGNVGLMRAVKKYDWRRGNRFSTYATWWIRQAVSRAVIQKIRVIRLPIHQENRLSKIYTFFREYYTQHGREPDIDTTAAALEISPDVVLETIQAGRSELSLDESAADGGDEDERNLFDTLADEQSLTPEEMYQLLADRDNINQALAYLTPRQARIIELRFGLNDNDNHTLEEVATVFGITRERIRQLESEALRRLRHPTMLRLLK